jgi:hypothetical protein
MGYMFKDITEYGLDFLEFCKTASAPVLDIAAAYGVASIKALEQGAYVIANDLDPHHLEILKSRVPDCYQARLQTQVGRFPSQLHFEPKSLSAVLAANMFHFLNGEEVNEAIRCLYNWLYRGGKAFIIAGSPYIRLWKGIIPVFERKKSEGDVWPGLVENTSLYPNERLQDLPKLMHFFDPEILAHAFEKAGFVIEKAGYISRASWPEDMQLDGRESVGIIAVKK